MSAYGDGIYVAGQRYVATRVEDRHIYGRQVRMFLPLPSSFERRSFADTSGVLLSQPPFV